MLSETKGQVHRLGEDEADKEEKFLPPTLVTDVDANDAVMQQEVSWLDSLIMTSSDV